MKLFSLTLFISFFISACYFSLSKNLSKSNPTEYIYHFPIYNVRKIIKYEFACDKYEGLHFEIGYYGSDLSKNTNFMKLEKESKVKNTNNTEIEKNNTFFLESNLISSGKSEMYYNWWGMLKLFPDYKIVIDSISINQTQIKIESEPKVKTGLGVTWNHGFPMFTSNTKRVKPSTIEEYEIIKLIGDSLGEKNMPEIIKPK